MSASQAVIYCRVSEVRQVDNMSLGSQERLCREYVERQGWTVGKIFVEKGESASTANRTQLNQLLRHCIHHHKAIVAVVVYAVDRFARDLHDYLVLRRLWQTGYRLLVAGEAGEALRLLPVPPLQEGQRGQGEAGGGLRGVATQHPTLGGRLHPL